MNLRKRIKTKKYRKIIFQGGWVCLGTVSSLSFTPSTAPYALLNRDTHLGVKFAARQVGRWGVYAKKAAGLIPSGSPPCAG